MHDIAYNVSTDINKFYTDFLLYQQFIPDGYTIYEDVNEVRIGEMLHYIPRGTLQSIERESLPIEYSENDYSEEKIYVCCVKRYWKYMLIGLVKIMWFIYPEA